MTKLTVKQRLIRRLWNDCKLIVNSDDIVSNRRSKHGGELVSWSTLTRSPQIQSIYTMTEIVNAKNIKAVNANDLDYQDSSNVVFIEIEEEL